MTRNYNSTSHIYIYIYINLFLKIINLNIINFRVVETYMVINFKTREISRGARKLTRTSTLIIIKKNMRSSLMIRL